MAKRKIRESHKTKKQEATPTPVSKLHLLLVILFIFVCSFAIYFNSLSNDFVYDDTTQVWDNPWIKDFRHLPEIFSKSVWSFQPGTETSNYYRPLMHVFYMFSYHIFGMNPWGFHLINVLFHCGASVLVFLIIQTLLTDHRGKSSSVYLSPPFAAGMLFASHPIHTETVAWLAGLPDVAFTFFYLLSFYLYILFRDGSKRDYLLSILSFVAAIFFKEPAITLPIVLMAYDHLFKKWDSNILAVVKRYIPYIVVSGTYLSARYYALRSFAPIESYAELSTYQSVINVFPLFRDYLTSLLWPFNLNVWHTFHPIHSIIEAKGMISIVVTIIFFIGAMAAYRKDKMVFFGLLLVFIPLLPVFYIKAIGGKPFAERYLYLPSVGYVLIMGVFFSWVKEKFPRAVGSTIIIFVIIIGSYSVATIKRNQVWRNDYTLFTDTVSKSPDAKDPRNRLGAVFMKKGKVDEAIEQYQAALQLAPISSVDYYNLGLAFSSKGRVDEAIAQFQAALQLDPDFADAHSGLATAYFNKGQIDKAIEQYEIALRLEPGNEQALNNLGLAYFRKGQYDKSIELYETALRFNPNREKVHSNLGLAYFNRGQVDKAIEQFKAAISLNPENPKYRTYLENAYKQRGRKQ
jgi:protein O-mannosyl-transferase